MDRIRSPNSPPVVGEDEGPEPKKSKARDDASSSGHGDEELVPDVASASPRNQDMAEDPQEREGMNVARSKSCQLLVRHFVEPWEGDYVLKRKKKIIEERKFSSEVVDISYSKEMGGADGQISQCLHLTVKDSDNMDALFKIVISATRIWCMDEVEVYFVNVGKSEDNGPFSPCNELKSLFSVLQSIQPLYSKADTAFREVLVWLEKKIHEEIKFYAKEQSVNYSDNQTYECYNIDYDGLLKWALDEGMEINLKVADVSEGERRFVASTDIDIGCTTLSIPEDKLIGVNVYYDADLREVLKGTFDPKEVLLLWCMKERYNADSKYKVYFDKLPEFNTGLKFGEDALAALEGTDLGGQILYIQRSLHYRFQQLKPIIDELYSIYPLGSFEWKDYLWANELLRSSSLEVCYPGEGRKLCLVPLLAFFSRSLCPHIMHCDTIDQTRCLKFVAVRPCQQGQQCYLSCGNISGADLVTYYGFLPMGNNHNDVIRIGFDQCGRPDDPQVHSEWPYQILRASWPSKVDLPEILVSYLCAFSGVKENKLSDKHNVRKMVLPVLKLLLSFHSELGGQLDDDDAQFMRTECKWDEQLALKYRKLSREMVQSALLLVSYQGAEPEPPGAGAEDIACNEGGWC